MCIYEYPVWHRILVTPAMKLLSRLVFSKFLQSPPNYQGFVKPADETEKHAVLIDLDATGLSAEVYEEYDLWSLEDELEAAVSAAAAGEFDGNECGPDAVRLFLYGPDAEELFLALEPVLSAHPLCQNATVVIRFGDFGAPSREIRIQQK